MIEIKAKNKMIEEMIKEQNSLHQLNPSDEESKMNHLRWLRIQLDQPSLIKGIKTPWGHEDMS